MAQCKYAMREHQISYDDGFSWTSLEVIRGDLIEYESEDCPDSGSEITKWVDLEGDYICEDNRKYKKQVLYVSYDNGVTWYIYFPTTYRTGEYVGIDEEYCDNKFEGHYEEDTSVPQPSGGGNWNPNSHFFGIDPLKIVKCNDNSTLTSAETKYYINNYNIISTKIGNCVREIGGRTFEFCNRLSAITIPSVITSIGYRAFYYCSGLTSITIPSGITSIGERAFYNCSGLQSIMVEAITPPTFGSHTFDNTNNCPIYVPCQSVDVYKSALSRYADRIQRMSDECIRYRTVTSSTCIDGDLYQLDEYQISTDFGVTWTTTATSATTIIESGASECSLVNQYLTFVPVSASTTFQFSKSGLSYSLDYGITWNPLAASTNTPLVSAGDRIIFKGTLTPSSTDGIGKFSASDKFDAEGNVMSLLYGDDFSGQTSLSGKNYAFRYLFSGSSVVDASALILPATTLSTSCYNSMFSNCYSLTTAPQLPATALAYGCYYGMFNGCTNLTTAPSSIGTSSTTMASNACYNMFRGCTSLTTAPQLPAMTMADYCYASMFNGCTSLQAAPMLPATTMANNCYYYMFANCSGLTIVQSNMLPATSLANNCYEDMFSNCTSLTTAPQLPATTLASSCYRQMFIGCSGLTVAPSSIGNSSTTMAQYTCDYMFYRCTSLQTAPELPATTLAESCYHSMFYDCTSLTVAPQLPATTLARGCYASMFSSCYSLSTPPVLSATTLANECYYYMFSNCTSLTTAPQLPATTLVYRCYLGMFNGCSSLTTAPTLSATTMAVECYYAMFNGCTSLTTAPQLPATTLADSCYREMFYGCTALTTPPVLSASTLANYCYASMFQGCTALTVAPELLATTLADYCYYYMFNDCRSLTTITCLAVDISADRCTLYWVEGVSSSGTFYKNPLTTSWESGSSGIPNGWTVQDAT